MDDRNPRVHLDDDEVRCSANSNMCQAALTCARRQAPMQKTKVKVIDGWAIHKQKMSDKSLSQISFCASYRSISSKPAPVTPPPKPWVGGGI